MRLAIISSHPIQYNAPLFIRLAELDGLEIKVFYSWKGTADQVDPEFGESITWDIPLLEGYDHTFIENISKDPGTHHFMGLDCPDLNSLIEQWKPDAVLIYGWAFKAHLSAIRYFHDKVPVFFRGDSTLISGGKGIRKIARKIWLKWVYRHVDHVLYVGQRNKEYFLKHGVGEKRLSWVPHSIDNRRFAQFDASQEVRLKTILNDLGVPIDSFKVLFAGKLVPRKMPDTLIDAVVQINGSIKGDQIQLIIVGEGPMKQLLEQKSAPYPFIHFRGFRNQMDMPAVYRMGEVFVLPSSIETWGLAVNEAFACSRPVIASDRVGCAPDLFLDGKTGFVFACGNVSELAEKIEHLYRDRLLCTTMGDNAFQLIEKWSTEEAADAMHAVISANTPHRV